MSPPRRFFSVIKWFSALWILLLPLSPRAFAWSAPGHMIVAAIAYDQLTDAERTKLDSILQGHPKYKIWMQAYPAAGIAELPFGKFAAMLASLYPDEIRNHDNPETFSEWHYIDYPLIPPDFPVKPAPTPGDDILTGLAKSANAVVKLTKRFDATPRATMLSFLLHLVGDVHQPLHCETLFDENFHEPEGDRGGNNAWVKLPGGETMKLHAVWDQLFGPGPQLFRVAPLSMIIACLHRSQELAAALPRTKLPELTAHTTPESWSLESRALAVSAAWRRHTLAYGLTEGTAAPLPADYLQKAQQVAERQVVLGGDRLADQLHAVLK